MTKTNTIKKLINGEIADADDVNQIAENVGTEGGLTPYDPTSHNKETDGSESLGTVNYPWGNLYVNRNSYLNEVDTVSQTVASSVLISSLREFLTLKDTPNSYVGKADKFLRVNSAEDAVVFEVSVVPDVYIPSTASKLLIPGKGANGGVSIIDVGSYRHVITPVATAQISTAQYKWADSSIVFDGNSDLLTIPDSAAFDMFLTKNQDWTISKYVRHTDHVGNECYMEQYEDTNNKWRLRHVHGSGVEFIMASGGGAAITLSGGGEITDTDWHWIVMVKIGDATTPKYAIYVDGVQVSYVADASQDSFNGGINIGQSGDSGHFFDGYMEQIIMEQANIFGANPDAGLTDTLTLPVEEQKVFSSGGDGQVLLKVLSAGSIKRWVLDT